MRCSPTPAAPGRPGVGSAWSRRCGPGRAGRSRPPWHTWFGPDAFGALVPDAALLAYLTADIPRVPLAYLEAVALPHRAWESVPCAYLRLSDAYAEEEAVAERLGWATARPLNATSD